MTPPVLLPVGHRSRGPGTSGSGGRVTTDHTWPVGDLINTRALRFALSCVARDDDMDAWDDDDDDDDNNDDGND